MDILPLFLWLIPYAPRHAQRSRNPSLSWIPHVIIRCQLHTVITCPLVFFSLVWKCLCSIVKRSSCRFLRRSTNAIHGVRASADGSASGYLPCLANAKTPMRMRPLHEYSYTLFVRLLGPRTGRRHTLSNDREHQFICDMSYMGMISPKKSSQPIIHPHISKIRNSKKHETHATKTTPTTTGDRRQEAEEPQPIAIRFHSSIGAHEIRRLHITTIA